MTIDDEITAARIAMIPTMPERLQKFKDAGGKVYTTEELREHFEVIAFSAPFISVTEKSTGKLGSMEFTHNPRFYFDFKYD